MTNDGAQHERDVRDRSCRWSAGTAVYARHIFVFEGEPRQAAPAGAIDPLMAKYAYHRTDANAEAILTAMEQVGASVYRGGPLDAVVGFRGDTVLVEIKTAKGKLRPSQKAFLARWRGNAYVIRTVEEGLKLISGIGRY